MFRLYTGAFFLKIISENTPMTNDKIDLVYLWVDGAEERFRRERDACLKAWLSSHKSRAARENIPSRWRDNDELRHSLRTAARYLPWINHIHIVTFDQTPSWLNTDNPKISVVSHSQIIPEEYLPTFNPDVIEACIPHIPNLAEKFIYANDDMYFYRPLTPSDFFDESGNPVVYVKHKTHFINDISDRNFARLYEKKHVYGKAILLTRRRFWEETGKNYPIIPCHNAEPFRKSYCLDTLARFKGDIDKMMPNKFRGEYDIEKLIFHLYDFYRKRNTLKLYADAGSDIILTEENLRTMTLRRLLNFFRPVRYNTLDGSHINGKIARANPKLVCINDDYSKPCKANIEFLDSLFPWKCEFEK